MHGFFFTANATELLPSRVLLATTQFHPRMVMEYETDEMPPNNMTIACRVKCVWRSRDMCWCDNIWAVRDGHKRCDFFTHTYTQKIKKTNRKLAYCVNDADTHSLSLHLTGLGWCGFNTLDYDIIKYEYLNMDMIIAITRLLLIPCRRMWLRAAAAAIVEEKKCLFQNSHTCQANEWLSYLDFQPDLIFVINDLWMECNKQNGDFTQMIRVGFFFFVSLGNMCLSLKNLHCYIALTVFFFQIWNYIK